MRPSLSTRLAVSATAVVALGLAGGVAAATPAQAAASCVLKVDPPLRSPFDLLPTLVSDTARIVCSAPVSKLELSVVLYRNGSQVAAATGSNLHLSGISVTATGVCIGGVYQARAVGRVTHPGVPAVQVLTGQSAAVPVVC